MTVKSVSSLVALILLTILIGCSFSPSVTQPASSEDSNKAGEAKSAQTAKVYDVSQEDITAIPGINSRSIAVAGVKLGDKTKDVDRLLGKPIKTESLPKLYRTAYENYGIYVDIDRYSAKVVSLYVNTNYYKKAKGNVAELLAHGSWIC